MDVRSLDRGLELLSVLSRVQSPLRASDLAGRLRIPRSSVYRFLKTLQARNLVEADRETRSFFLGPGVLEFASTYRSGRWLNRIAFPFMTALAEETGETVLLTVRSGDHAICLERVESRAPIRLSLEPGATLPLHAGASEKILLAHLPESEREQVIKAGLPRLAARTITRPSALRRHLAEIREAGYALSLEEVDPGVVAVGAPIRDNYGHVVAGLSAAGPSARLAGPRLDRTIRAVLRCAQQISEALGGGVPQNGSDRPKRESGRRPQRLMTADRRNGRRRTARPVKGA